MPYHTINNSNKVNSNKEAIQYSSRVVSGSDEYVQKTKPQYINIKSPEFTTFIGYIVNAFRAVGKPIYSIGGSPTPDNSKVSVFLYDIVNKIFYGNDPIDQPITDEEISLVLDQDKQAILASFVPVIDTTDIDEVKQQISDIDDMLLLIDQKIQQIRAL